VVVALVGGDEERGGGAHGAPVERDEGDGVVLFEKVEHHLEVLPLRVPEGDNVAAREPAARKVHGEEGHAVAQEGVNELVGLEPAHAVGATGFRAGVQTPATLQEMSRLPPSFLAGWARL